MKVSAITRMGRGKTASDDRVLVGGRILVCDEWSGRTELPAVVGIADGVGGNAGGDIAAQYVCERIYGCSTDMDDIAGVNAGLLELSQKTPGKAQMAATFSGVFIAENKAVKLLHIGNTRVYSIQGGYLKQLTSDMTTYNYYMSLGRTEEAQQCSRSEITACFGGGTNSLFRPQLTDIPAAGSLLITSDGVHDFLELDRMEDIITAAANDLAACRELLDSALAAGSEDDMSAVILRL
ncbi:MAG: PP2C family protein-serine/threonine phosphatase [Oscillospiraceae bacterium]